MSGPRATPPTEPDLRYFRSPGNRRVRKRRLARVGVKWAALASIHAAIAVVLLWSGSRLLGLVATSPRFALDRVVVTGASRTTENEVRRALSGALGHNVLRVDLEDVGRRVESLAWVERAAVRRVLPRGLEIEVVERVPRARVAVGEATYLIDATGRVLEAVSGDSWAELALVRGLGIPGTPDFERGARRAATCLERLRNTEPAWFAGLAELDVSRPDVIAASTVEPGPRILLDPRAVERNLEHYLALAEDIRSQFGPAEVVDLRWRDRIAVVPVPEKTEETDTDAAAGAS